MTPEERQMLSGLFDRVRGAATGPKDRDAEAFIEDAMRNTPSAGYVLAQTVLVQQQALEAAAHRLSELEAQAKEAAPQQETSFLGNIGRSLFGGGPSPAQQPQQQARPYDARGYERDPGPPPGYAPQRPAYAPPPQQGYAPPPPQGGPWGAPPPAQGGGFLQGALQTATGVAGGVLLGNALGGLFGGHGGGGGGGLFGGGSAFAQPRESVNETVNNYYGSDPDAQRAQDYLQDQDQDQDAQQDAADYGGDDYDNGGGGDDYA
jgi:hypothetical protein